MKFKTVNWITNKKSSSYKPQAPSSKRSKLRGPRSKAQAHNLRLYSKPEPSSGSGGTSHKPAAPSSQAQASSQNPQAPRS